jgi:para-aminobenzoate synthetase
MRTLIIDNYDSFTYNLFQEVARINQVEPIVIKNDDLSLNEIRKLSFDNVIISPGPGHPAKPKDFGICSELIQNLDVPILGICLGHQGIVTAFGGEVTHAPQAIHGQISKIYPVEDELFLNIPSHFNAVRYHSLIAKYPLPDCLKAIAFTDDELIMAVKHQTRPIWGVQYHPESICSEYGQQLLINFKNLSEQYLSQQYTLEVKKITSSITPDEYFQQHLREKQQAIWLDSSRVIENYSRFSIMGCLDGPLSHHISYDMSSKTITCFHQEHIEKHTMSIFDYLRKQLNQYHTPVKNLPFDFQCGYVGYFGYELFQETLDMQARHHSPHPDAQFIFLDRAIVYDHQEQVYYLLALTKKNQKEQSAQWFQTILKSFDTFQKNLSTKKIPFKSTYFSQSQIKYLENIQTCLDYIQEGESYEICLTNRLKYPEALPGLDYYLNLRAINPAPYGGYLRFNDLEIASSSIERFLKINPKGLIQTKPIKGTLPRGKTIEEDQLLKQELQNNIKYKSENLMIVDLLRNDLGKICEIGSVHVPKLMNVESYQTVHQLVSTIEGQVKPEFDAIDCIKALFPGGSMTGAPKIRTVEIIQSLEDESRNIYSGALGYLSCNGCVDLNIVIRTAVITPQEMVIGVGGAIIALSNPEEEIQEIILKSQSLQEALKNISQEGHSLLESSL